eukprot:11157772-Lingulodinium_polyedra.AAC.1
MHQHRGKVRFDDGAELWMKMDDTMGDRRRCRVMKLVSGRLWIEDDAAVNREHADFVWDPTVLTKHHVEKKPGWVV